MDLDAVRAATVAERQELAEWLAGLDDDALETPSLCAGWCVRTVAAHLAVAMNVEIAAFLGQTLRSGLNFHRANDAMAREWAKKPRTEIVAAIRRGADRRLTNPGTGPQGPLTDVLVHTADMRRPLGLPHQPAPEHVLAALDFLTGWRAVGFVPRGRLAGLRLVASDLPFANGKGAQMVGSGADLMMAASGRSVVLPALSGPGVDVLADRLSRE